MNNPFEGLGQKQVIHDGHEEVGGVFSCQTCFERALTAKYYRDTQLLLWVCKNEHISKIESFVL